MQVNFHGKLRAVNKTSYEKFLKTNGVIVSANNLHCFKNFNEAMKHKVYVGFKMDLCVITSQNLNLKNCLVNLS